MPVEDYKLMNVPSPDELAPYFDDWVEHETDDEFWKRWKISDHYSEMNVKGLHGMGWHDIFLKGSIKNFTGLRSGAKTPEARAGQRMLMGPWAHAATSSEGKVGNVVFGEQVVVDMDQVKIDWFDYALKGNENSYATGGPIRLFVMGENAWGMSRALLKLSGSLVHDYATISDDSPSPNRASRARRAATSAGLS